MAKINSNVVGITSKAKEFAEMLVEKRANAGLYTNITAIVSEAVVEKYKREIELGQPPPKF